MSFFRVPLPSENEMRRSWSMRRERVLVKSRITRRVLIRDLGGEGRETEIAERYGFLVSQLEGLVSKEALSMFL